MDAILSRRLMCWNRFLTCPLFVLCAWSVACGPAWATKCIPKDLPPITAAEQALLDQHALAVRRAQLDLDSAIATDPLLGGLVEPIRALQAVVEAEGQPLPFPPSVRALVRRDELAALLYSIYALNFAEAASRIDLEAATQAPRGVPVWELLDARRLEIAGHHTEANQAIRRYLARSAESGRTNPRVRRLAFRWLALVFRHPEPPSPLPERNEGCGIRWDGLIEDVVVAVAHDFEAAAAWALVAEGEEEATGLLCGSMEAEASDAPEDDSDSPAEPAYPRTEARALLCLQLQQHLQQHAPMLAAMVGRAKEPDGDRWLDACQDTIRTTAAAPDWRTKLDQLAVTGCPMPPPDEATE